MCVLKHASKQCNKQAICNLLSEKSLAVSATVKVRRSVKFHRHDIESRRTETEALKAGQL